MFDRFAIIEAYYAFAFDNHAGQDCPIYAYFARLEDLGFRPRISLSGFDSLEDEAAIDTYLALCKRHGISHPAAAA